MERRYLIKYSGFSILLFVMAMKTFRLPKIFFDVSSKIGFLSPAEVFDGQTDVALNIGRHWTGAIVILVVAFAGVDIDEVVLDGTLYTTGHIVIDRGESDWQTNGLIMTVLWTIFSLHLGVKQVDTGDIDSILGFITGKNAMEAMLTKRACLTETDGVVVCLFCEDFCTGLWVILFLLHSCHF